MVSADSQGPAANLTGATFSIKDPAAMPDPTRRDALKRLGALGLVVGGAAATAKLAYDPGGFGLAQASGERQVRDFRIHHAAARDSDPVFAIAKSSTDPAELVRRAVNAMGGMKRFVSR